MRAILCWPSTVEDENRKARLSPLPALRSHGSTPAGRQSRNENATRWNQALSLSPLHLVILFSEAAASPWPPPHHLLRKQTWNQSIPCTEQKLELKCGLHPSVCISKLGQVESQELCCSPCAVRHFLASQQALPLSCCPGARGRDMLRVGTDFLFSVLLAVTVR